MDDSFLTSRIAAVKAQIEILEDAFASLASGAIVSYTLDTGQSRQTVTKSDISTISNTLDSLYNRLASLEARLTGCGTVIARPHW